MKLEGEIPMELLDYSNEEDDDACDNILCGFCLDHPPLYNNVTCLHQKKPPEEAACMESVESAIEFDLEVAFESGIELDLAVKTTELETNDNYGSDDSNNESLEDHFNDSDMEGEELTLFNNGVVV